jgi:hypothetical protein
MHLKGEEIQEIISKNKKYTFTKIKKKSRKYKVVKRKKKAKDLSPSLPELREPFPLTSPEPAPPRAIASCYKSSHMYIESLPRIPMLPLTLNGKSLTSPNSNSKTTCL